MRHVVIRLLNRRFAKAYDTWSAYAEEQLAKLRLMRGFAVRMLKAGLSKAWGSWMEHVHERYKMRGFIGRLLNREVARAWEQWRDALRTGLKLQKFARRLLQYEVVRAWGQWGHATDQMVRARAFGYRVLNAALVAAFNTWVEARLAMRRYTRTIRRLVRSNLARAFNTWSDGAASQAYAAMRVENALLGWTGGNLTRGFRRWAEVASNLADRMATLNRVYLRMSNLKKAQVHAAHLTRAARPTRARRSRTRAAASRARGDAVDSLASANVPIRQVYDAWYHVTSGRKRKRDELFRRALGLMRMYMVAKLFYAWQDLRRHATSYEARVRMAVNMFRSRILTQCFGSWVHVSAGATELRRRAVGRFVHALLSRCFASWVEEIGRLRKVKGQLSDVTSRLKNRGLVLCFQAWRDYTVDKRERMGSALSRWANAALAKAFDKWSADSLEGRRLRDLGYRVLKRYMSALLAKCYNAWVSTCSAAQRRKDLHLRRSMALMSGRADILAQLCMQLWHEWASAQGSLRAALAAKFYGRYLNATLTRVFLAWSGLCATANAARQRKKLRVASALSASPEVLRASTFDRWRGMVDEKKRKREEVVSFALRRLQHGLLHVCFTAWLASMPEGGRRGQEEEDQGALVAALRAEVSSLKAHMGELSKNMAMQERSKAYRYEINLMRDELHSFLFNSTHDASRAAAHPRPIVSSHSQSESDDDADSAEGLTQLLDHERSPPRSMPGSRPGSGRPRSGGPTGRLEQVRPQSARAGGRAKVPAVHEIPIIFRGERKTSPARMRATPTRPSPTTVGGSPGQAALASGYPSLGASSAPLRARPPSASRPPTSGPRHGKLLRDEQVAAPQTPHFMCSSMGSGASISGTHVPGVSLSVLDAGATSWGSKNHFAMQLPRIN